MFRKFLYKNYSGIIGTGTYGICSRMEHDASHRVMAVKVHQMILDKYIRYTNFRESELMKSID